MPFAPLPSPPLASLSSATPPLPPSSSPLAFPTLLRSYNLLIPAPFPPPIPPVSPSPPLAFVLLLTMLRLASNDVLTLVLFPPPAPLPPRTARFRSDSLLVAARLKRRCYSTAVPAAHPAHPLRRSRLQCFIVFLVSCPPLAFYSSAVAPFAPSSLLAFAMVSRSANVLTLAPFPPPAPPSRRSLSQCEAPRLFPCCSLSSCSCSPLHKFSSFALFPSCCGSPLTTFLL